MLSKELLNMFKNVFDPITLFIFNINKTKLLLCR